MEDTTTTVTSIASTVDSGLKNLSADSLRVIIYILIIAFVIIGVVGVVKAIISRVDKGGAEFGIKDGKLNILAKKPPEPEPLVEAPTASLITDVLPMDKMIRLAQQAISDTLMTEAVICNAKDEYARYSQTQLQSIVDIVGGQLMISYREVLGESANDSITEKYFKATTSSVFYKAVIDWNELTWDVVKDSDQDELEETADSLATEAVRALESALMGKKLPDAIRESCKQRIRHDTLIYMNRLKDKLVGLEKQVDIEKKNHLDRMGREIVAACGDNKVTEEQVVSILTASEESVWKNSN